MDVSIVGLLWRVFGVLRIGLPLALVGILAVVGMLAFARLSGPSATVSADGLGTSAIGQFLRGHFLWEISEDDVRRGIKELLENSAAKERSDIESIGMHCYGPPSTACGYVGTTAYRFGGIPRTSPAYGKQTVITMRIKLLSYTDPNTLVVRKEVETSAE
jgi:hypothetical protein